MFDGVGDNEGVRRRLCVWSSTSADWPQLTCCQGRRRRGATLVEVQSERFDADGGAVGEV